MAEDVKMRFAGDSSDGERAIAQLERKYEGLENRLKRLHELTKQHAKDGAKGMQDWAEQTQNLVKNLTGIATPFDLAATAIATFKREFDDLIERQKTAEKTGKDYAKVLEGLAVSLHGDPSLDLPTAKTKIADMAVKTGVAPRFLGAALDEGISAKGHLPAAEVIPMVEAVAKAVPNLPEQHAKMVATGLDVRKTDPRVTPEGYFDLMLSAKQQARVTDIESFSQHAMPGIIGLTKLDKNMNWKENAAIYSALTNAAQDPSGRKTRTASVALALQMKEFLPDVPELDTNLERIRFFQNNPEARRAFLYGGDFQGKKRSGIKMAVTGPGGEQFEVATDRASFERQMFPAIEGLLGGTKTDVESLNEALRTIRDPRSPEAIAGYNKFVETTQRDPTIANAVREGKLNALADVYNLENVSEAAKATTWEGLNKNLSALGIGYTNRTLTWMDFQYRTQWQGMEGSAATQEITREMADIYRGAKDDHPMIKKLENIAKTLETIDKHLTPLGKIEDNTKPQPGLGGQVEAGANQ